MRNPPTTPLETVRKALKLQRAYIARGTDVRRHHYATLQALQLAESFIAAGYVIDAVIEAIRAKQLTDAHIQYGD
jgi:thiamine biosynthesis lipoprotein ApbE